MNWKEIEKQYPKSYSELENSEIGGLIWDRTLYDFFDENHIYIEILFSYVQIVFHSFITYDNTFVEDDGFITKKHKTRSEAESSAFIKAFELLENKLP